MIRKHRILSGIGIAVVTTLAVSGCATNHPATASSPPSTAAATNQATTNPSTTSQPASNQATTTNTAGAGTPSTNNNNTATGSTTTGSSAGSTTSVTTNVATSQPSPASNNAAGSASGAQSGSASQSAFPTIINMAMKNFPANVLQGAEAPTVVPMPASGSNELFYKTADSTTRIMSHPGSLSSYSVTLSSPTHQIADFSGHRYDTSAHASQTMSYALMSTPLSGKRSTTFVGTNHHKAILAVDKNSSTSVISWAEGNWTIAVKNDSSTSAPTSAANQVANYLDAHFMPIPHNMGSIVVETGTSGTVAVVTWQENNLLFETDANRYAKDPISTALEMAISMRSY